MDDTTALLLVVGGLIGLFAGRVWAELFRARFDQKKIWKGRKDYRQGEQRYLLPVFLIAAVLFVLYMLGSYG